MQSARDNLEVIVLEASDCVGGRARIGKVRNPMLSVRGCRTMKMRERQQRQGQQLSNKKNAYTQLLEIDGARCLARMTPVGLATSRVVSSSDSSGPKHCMDGTGQGRDLRPGRTFCLYLAIYAAFPQTHSIGGEAHKVPA